MKQQYSGGMGEEQGAELNPWDVPAGSGSEIKLSRPYLITCFTDPAGLFFLHSKKKSVAGGLATRMRTIVEVKLVFCSSFVCLSVLTFDKAKPTSDKA